MISLFLFLSLSKTNQQNEVNNKQPSTVTKNGVYCMCCDSWELYMDQPVPASTLTLPAEQIRSMQSAHWEGSLFHSCSQATFQRALSQC